MSDISQIARNKKDAEAFMKQVEQLDKPIFPENNGKIHLRLIKSHDREIICDQEGREVEGILGFQYEQMGIDEPPKLTLTLIVNQSKWAPRLGFTLRGINVDD